jgi:hypothetical protein
MKFLRVQFHTRHVQRKLGTSNIQYICSCSLALQVCDVHEVTEDPDVLHLHLGIFGAGQKLSTDCGRSYISKSFKDCRHPQLAALLHLCVGIGPTQRKVDYQLWSVNSHRRNMLYPCTDTEHGHCTLSTTDVNNICTDFNDCCRPRVVTIESVLEKELNRHAYVVR